MRLGPFEITRRRRTVEKAAVPITQWPAASPSWWPFPRPGGETSAGSWQRGTNQPIETVVTHPTFWSGITLIAGDVAKLRLMLTEEDADGICQEVENSAYSPVIRKPNHYQNRIQFWEWWILSKLTRGNTYALKSRDNRGVVDALYLLDAARVYPMVASSGAVYYALSQDELNLVPETSIVVPAREMIHDRWNCLYHKLIGLSPIFACGHMALQGQKIIHHTTTLFEHGAQLGGILTAPGAISEENVKRVEKYWAENYSGPQNAGKTAVIGDGLKFDKPPVMTSVDAQLIEQLKWGDEKICGVLHLPPYMVGVGGMPTYNNVEALNQQYYSQCLQVLIEAAELSLDEGLELNAPLYTEFDLEGLLRMDSTQQMDTATKGVVGGIYAPNEARRKFRLPKVDGGESPYLQVQNYSLEALARRDAQESLAPPPPVPALPPAPADMERALPVALKKAWLEARVREGLAA